MGFNEWGVSLIKGYNTCIIGNWKELSISLYHTMTTHEWPGELSGMNLPDIGSAVKAGCAFR